MTKTPTRRNQIRIAAGVLWALLFGLAIVWVITQGLLRRLTAHFHSDPGS